MKIIKCKTTGKEFKDIDNKSGCITEHLKGLNINVSSSYIRRQFLKQNGQMWHMQYFDILEIQDKETKKCKYCEWKTFDLDNKSGQYTLHLKEKHNKDINQYIEEFSEEKILFNTFFNKQELRQFINSSEDNYITCKVCNEKLKKITNSHLRKHNLSLFEYKLNFSIETLSECARQNCIKVYEENLKFLKNTYTSSGHKEILDFLFELGLNYEVNNKSLLKGIELDILIHEKKIAIEYNGLLYHSEIFDKKSRSYHLNKTKQTNEHGYSLIHIFEDDWIHKKSIVKSKLKHLLGMNKNNIIHARKCVIKEINSTLKNEFLNNNHIQGEDMSNIHIGAYNNDELVSVMTFDNKRKMSIQNNDNDSFELKRFATKIDYRIPGIASKLLKFFINNNHPKKIISFADKTTTINNENLYTKLGFICKKVISPDYKYFNPRIARNKRLHKFGFGKNSIKKKFPEVYHIDKTEWEMMQELGYDRIWDCGKFRYEMEIKNAED